MKISNSQDHEIIGKCMFIDKDRHTFSLKGFDLHQLEFLEVSFFCYPNSTNSRQIIVSNALFSLELQSGNLHLVSDYASDIVFLPITPVVWSRVSVFFSKTSVIFTLNRTKKEALLIDGYDMNVLLEKPIILSPDQNFVGCIENMKIKLNNSSLSEEMIMPSYPPNTELFQEHIIKPIQSLSELKEWTPDKCKPYEKARIKLKKRPQVRQGSINQVLLSHDYKGGYIDDNSPYGSDNVNSYNFYQWSMIDIFNYFSHHRVTIPPPSWTNAGHKNGVKVLGTFITEWSNENPDTLELINGTEGNVMYYADKLVELAVTYGFDGWLFNIEDNIPEADVVHLVKFMKYITVKMHEAKEGSLIVWYDAITIEGNLIWQNELNELNKPFFDACDGIFLNYFWVPSNIEKSKAVAGHRFKDVFVGIDVFGRGTFGGGGFDSHKATNEISKHGLSCALFAPGWLLEDQAPNDREKFENLNRKFWGNEMFVDLMQLKEPSFDQEGEQHWKRLPVSDGYNPGEHDPSLPSSVYVSSFKWCIRSAFIDIASYGVQNLRIDRVPLIEASERYTGTGPDVSDSYKFQVTLYDDDLNVLASFDSGELKASSEWKQAKILFSHYGSNLRYIRWCSHGKDAEHWQGYFGTKISSPSFKVYLPQDESLSAHITPVANILALPLCTNFNSGKGNLYCLKGEKIIEKNWSNLDEQDILPDILSAIKYYDNEIVTMLDYEKAWFGGSSLKFYGKMYKQKRIPLFSCHVDLPKNKPFFVEYIIQESVSPDIKSRQLRLALEFTNGSMIYLNEDNKDIQCIISQVNHWLIFQFEISKFDGMNLKQVYCILEPNEFYLANLGSLKIYTDPSIRSIPPHISNIQVERSFNINSILTSHELEDMTFSWGSKGAESFLIFINNEYKGRTFNKSFQIGQIPATPEQELFILPVNEMTDYALKEGTEAYILY